jgi:hypothetical protein
VIGRGVDLAGGLVDLRVVTGIRRRIAAAATELRRKRERRERNDNVQSPNQVSLHRGCPFVLPAAPLPTATYM